MIDLRKPYQWDDLNDNARALLGFEGAVRLFQSPAHAIFEIAMGAQNLYAHKKLFYHSLGFGTHADDAVLYLARQGTKGIEFKASEPPEIDDKKTLFFLCDVDDAVTGELLHDPETSSLDLKVFRIWLSHRWHHFSTPPKAIGDNDIIIYAGGEGPTVVHLGRRAQGLQVVIAPTLDWNAMPAFKGFPSASENKKWVESVEMARWGSSTPFITSPVPRLFDRAALVFADLDGGAVRDLLIQKNPQRAEKVEAVSLSRWNEAKLLTQFEKRGLSPEVFRGLLLIESGLAGDGRLHSDFDESVAALRGMSGCTP